MDDTTPAKTSPGQVEEIFILPVNLLDQHRPQVEALKSLARALGIGLGWHYLLDWAWMLAKLGEVRGMHILDAGAGEGLLQWYLAEHAAEVTSVDRSSRSELSLRFRARYNVHGLRPNDLTSASNVLSKNIRQASGLKGKSLSLARGTAGLLKIALPKNTPGKVTIYNQDLASMPHIPDNSMDAVVAVSALEHNSPQGLSAVVNELVRVLKPGGLLLATLGAAPDQDWFHEPSKGWCYTEASLRRYFNLASDIPSNYADYGALMSALKACAELRDNLAGFYFRSGDNGMPWGKWDPQYQSVAVCKQKASAP
jgi:ubiquinone/menaquinone biosynthesis C-methylase UbiE